MTPEITRDLIVDRLGSVTYDRFLFYLMGPYKSFNLNYVLSEEEREISTSRIFPDRCAGSFGTRT